MIIFVEPVRHQSKQEYLQYTPYSKYKQCFPLCHTPNQHFKAGGTKEQIMTKSAVQHWSRDMCLLKFYAGLDTIMNLIIVGM